MIDSKDLKLFEKTMRKIVREEVKAESENLEAKINSELKLFRMRLQNEMLDLTDNIKTLQVKINKLDLQISKLRKDMQKTSDFLDRDNLRTLGRVKRMEEHLQLPQDI
jgi:predicted  nucleic acid-binding Zn-ribbon protein